MQPIARRSGTVCWLVCLYVGLLVTTVSPPKAAESTVPSQHPEGHNNWLIVMPFGMLTRWTQGTVY